MNKLIDKAKNASIEFDAIMDSIDFNSYLPEDKNIIVKNTPGYEKYKNYKDLVDDAEKCCDDVISDLPAKLIEKIKEAEKKGGSFLPDSNKEKEMTQCLVYHLFEAKKTRLEGRKQVKREKEKKKYVDCSHRLHRAFDIIPKENFYDKQKSLTDNFNWVKVLYYNEISICYSGLAESSMSLGYAERSILLLKEIYPKIDSFKDVSDKNIKLYTFALCNKGEAERNLHDYDKALLTFKKIIDRCEENGNGFPDYYQALFGIALILIYQGRGDEAIKFLEKMKILNNDYRLAARDLEIASAYIDQKEYDKAIKKLNGYKDEKKWGLTFTFRKALLYRILCLLEWRKNQPKEFGKNIEWTQDYNDIPIKIKGNNADAIGGIITECINRNDGDNFKKAYRYFSEFHKQRGKIENKLSDEDKKNAKELELFGYFLYLFYEKMDNIRDINDLNDIQNKFQGENNDINEILDKIEDTDYLNDFFNCYIEYLKCNRNDDQYNKVVIEKLYNRLKDLYRENDNLSKLCEVEEKFRPLKEKSEKLVEEEKEKKENKEKDKNKAVEFIQKCFFQGKPFQDDEKSVFLHVDSILSKMEQNTLDFAEKIVGKTRRFFPNERFRAILTVLRRWNSFTPALSSSVNPSKGGGYFLYFQYKTDNSYGIVIDPGYDFLENLFSQGYRIGDIDTVIVSHSHPDHTDNLPSILSLFHELNDDLGKYYYSRKLKEQPFNRKHIKLIISQGVFDQYYKLIKPSEESLKDIIVIQPGNERAQESFIVQRFNDKYSIEIQPFTTLHKDLGQWGSLGFKISIKNKGTTRTIGYTSDAIWNLEFSKKFKDCHIICAHLGSIVDILGEKGFCSLCNELEKCNINTLDECIKERFINVKTCIEKMDEHARGQKHLYLSGLSMFFNEMLSKREDENNNMELAIISEFGEELKNGIRMDLYNKFNSWFGFEINERKPMCLPGDIGLEVDVFTGNVYCHCCKRFVDRAEIEPVPYGKEEAICFVCKECKEVLSSYQIGENLKNFCENGRTLELAEESK